MGAPKIKSNISDIKSYTSSKEKYPMFVARVQAGFPSPGDDYIEKNLDLNELLIRNPSATFFVKVEGDSMVNAGINSGDTLVVDKALEAKDKSVVIAHINGELTVKRIWLAKGKVFLSKLAFFIPTQFTKYRCSFKSFLKRLSNFFKF